MTSSSGRIGFTGALTLLFIGLKLCNVIHWSWLWVLSPIWIDVLLALVILSVAALITLLLKWKSLNSIYLRLVFWCICLIQIIVLSIRKNNNKRRFIASSVHHLILIPTVNEIHIWTTKTNLWCRKVLSNESCASWWKGLSYVWWDSKRNVYECKVDCSTSISSSQRIWI